MNRLSLTISFCFLFGLSAQAQFDIYGLDRSSSNKNSNRLLSLSDTLELPFRDDFANSLPNVSTSRWFDAENVFVDPSIGINPPNIHVASMDGLKVNGDPYAIVGGSGEADVLTSKHLRLGGLIPSDSVYLSFFWQQSGFGEKPENADKLTLQFKSLEGNWADIFILDSSSVSTEEHFQHTFIKVAEEYLYDGFQFRWVTYCDLNGRFDVWNLDYVLVDKNRSSKQKGIPDSGLGNYPGALFNNYYSVPIAHLKGSPEIFKNNKGSSIRFRSLKESNPDLEHAFSSSIIAFDSNEVITTLHNQKKFTTGNDFIHDLNILPAEPSDIGQYAESNHRDSLIVNWQTFSTDTQQSYFDNDTVNAKYLLHNYYSLDDGTAEFAGGAKSYGAQVAMKYGIPVHGQHLTHIDICFVNYEGVATSVALDLIVWKRSVGGLPGEELSRTPVILTKKDSINEFTSYMLSEFDLINEDTIFIGYEHREDADVFIGLDRNTRFSSFLYSRSAEQQEGVWEKYTKLGTPMIRPRFDERLITGINNSLDQVVKAYPNPTSGNIFLKKGSVPIKLMDLMGREIKTPISTSGEEVVMDLGALPVGIYILDYIFEDRTFTQKIVKQ